MAQMTNQAQAIPSDLAEGQSGRSNLKFIVGGFLLLAVVIALIVQATMSTGAYYMTVDEVRNSTGLVGERVRVSGAVVAGSEDWNPQEITLRFAISDEKSTQELPIVFFGPRPDNFQRAASAIVEGELLPDGTFKAETLLLKCPSRYEEDPEEVFVTAEK
jgi:cytochrome c-type biogenesis protein CcmE